MLKGIRGFFGGISNSVTGAIKSLFSPLTSGIKDIYTHITEQDAEEIKDSPESAAEVIDTIADGVLDHEDSAALEDISQTLYEENISSRDFTEDKPIGDAIDDFLERYDIGEWEPMPEGTAIDDNERYHMTITYTATLIDGSVIEREIERYNFMNDDTIRGMVWENLFSEGDGDGGDVDTGDVEDLTWDVESYW